MPSKPEPTPEPGPLKNAGSSVSRSAAKAERRVELLTAAAALMAERGFHSVRLDDVGAAVGVSGPALYRHFNGKPGLLTEVLVDISERLLTGGRRVLAEARSDDAAVDALIAFHVEFAFTETNLIRVQDRELLNLEDSGRARVAQLQREYLACWYEPVGRLRPELDSAGVQARCRAVVGMINASRHVVGRRLGEPTRDALPGMCRAALGL